MRESLSYLSNLIHERESVGPDDASDKIRKRRVTQITEMISKRSSDEDASVLLQHFLRQAVKREGIFQIRRNERGERCACDSYNSIIADIEKISVKVGEKEWKIDGALTEYIGDLDKAVAERGHQNERWYKKSRTAQMVSGEHVGVFPLRDVEGGGWYQDIEFGVRQRREAMQFLSNTDKIEPATIQYLVDRMKIDDVDYRENFDSLIKILNKNAPLAGEYLMRFIQEEKDPYLKALATRTLYQLELGKIGMSENGVGYLGKVFDLGGQNNPNHFAHRATGNGQVAIFDENKRALGYFQLHGLDSPEDKIKAEMLEFTYDTLFHAKPDETSEEREEREKILEEFRKKYFDTYITDFHEQTGVRFNNLNFKEQGWFLWYIQHASEEDKKRAVEFITKYREDGFKTFLSLEQDIGTGGKILDIGEKMPQPVATAIFKKYDEVVQAAEEAENFLSQKFGQRRQFDSGVANLITNNLLRRAKDLVAKYSDEAHDSQDKEELSKKIKKELNLCRADIWLFASAFKHLFEEKKLELKDIVGIALETKDSGELTEEEKLEMRDTFAGNRAEEGAVFVNTRLQTEFDPVVNEAGHKFYILKNNGAIISFARFDEL